MAWDETDRAKYAAIKDRHASDLSDAEFALLGPILPAAKRHVRKPTDAQSILNAVLSQQLTKLGNQLRQKGLPTGDLALLLNPSTSAKRLCMGQIAPQPRESH